MGRRETLPGSRYRAQTHVNPHRLVRRISARRVLTPDEGVTIMRKSGKRAGKKRGKKRGGARGKARAFARNIMGGRKGGGKAPAGDGGDGE
jgi:hypothetical protein